MKIDINTVLVLGVAVAGVYVVSRIGGVHQAGSNLLKPIADGIGNIISQVKYAGEGVQSTNAGVILRQKDFVNGALKPLAFEAQRTMHPANPQILQFILGPGGTLREPYRSALNTTDVILILPDGTIETGV